MSARVQSAAYTPDTLRSIREAANKGFSLNGHARHLGWRPEFLKRICRMHGIEFSREDETLEEREALVRRPEIPKPKPIKIIDACRKRKTADDLRSEQLSVSTRPPIMREIERQAQARCGGNVSRLVHEVLAACVSKHLFDDLLGNTESSS